MHTVIGCMAARQVASNVLTMQVPVSATESSVRGPWSQIDDHGLLLRVASGDKPAFTEFARRHMHGMLGLARRYVSLTEAEDIVQEAFTRVWLKAGQWQDRGISPRSWLARIVYNLCMDSFRQRRDEDAQALDGLSIDEPGPERQVEQAARQAFVLKALQALPERQRSAIHLTVYHSLTNRESAEVLGISIEALESLLSRARRQLRAVLQQQEASSL